jgi:hypothetical protein
VRSGAEVLVVLDSDMLTRAGIAACAGSTTALAVGNADRAGGPPICPAAALDDGRFDHHRRRPPRPASTSRARH